MGKRHKDANSGFTLVELIVVITIIAILAAISIPSIGGYLARAKKANALADANQLASALNLYNSTARDADRLDGEKLLETDIGLLRERLIEFGIMPPVNGNLDAVVSFLSYENGLFLADGALIDENINRY